MSNSLVVSVPVEGPLGAARTLEARTASRTDWGIGIAWNRSGVPLMGSSSVRRTVTVAFMRSIRSADKAVRTYADHPTFFFSSGVVLAIVSPSNPTPAITR